MTKTAITSIAVVCFLLGYSASEYRWFAPASPASDNKVSLESAPAVTETSPAQIPLESPVVDLASQAIIFSLDDAAQLLSEQRYGEAIAQLQEYLRNNAGSADAWALLANAAERQGNHELALDAWFRYLNIESDIVKREAALESIKGYLLKLANTPAQFEDSWLIAQVDRLLDAGSHEGELHLLQASLYASEEDDYQAQYHALMAANDPALQQRAETILAQLGGEVAPEDLTIPLIKLGNQFLVNVVIEGRSARLLLDTGASLSGVSDSYTRKFPGIVKATRPIRLNTAAGPVDTVLFTVEQLALGDLHFDQHILALLPMHSAVGFDGLLGVDILGRFDFVIDQNVPALRLRPRSTSQ
jgi:predicted aspartyl protease